MKREIDKIIRDKILNHQSDYPANMWSKIDDAINPVKEKDRIIYFILGTLLILSTLFIMNIGTQNLQKISNQTITKSNIKSNLIPGDITTDNLDASQGENDFVYKSQENGQLSKKLFNTDVINTDSNDNEVYPNSNFKPKHAGSSPKKSKSGDQLINPSYSTNSNSSSHRNFTFTNPILNTSQLNLELSTKKDQNFSDNNTVKGDQRNSYSKEKTLNTLAPIDNLLFSSSSNNLELTASNYKALTDCPSWVREKMGLYIDVYFSPEYGIRALTSKTTDSLNLANQKQRNETESALLSYSFGARLLFLSPNGVSFKTGLNYSQINEKFSHQNPDSKRDIIIIDSLPSGEVVVQQWTEYGEEKLEIINRYKSIDIPFIFGYERYKGGKFSYSMNTGIYFNIFSEQRGMFLTPEGNREWFTSGEDGNYKAYKNGVGVSFFGSFGLMYHWVEGIDFFMEPSIRYYLSSFTRDDYPHRQNYAVVGLHTGLRYRF